MDWILFMLLKSLQNYSQFLHGTLAKETYFWVFFKQLEPVSLPWRLRWRVEMSELWFTAEFVIWAVTLMFQLLSNCPAWSQNRDFDWIFFALVCIFLTSFEVYSLRLEGKRMLELLRGKRLVFAGDSLNRNMWESLVCILRNSLPNKKQVFEISGRTEYRANNSYAVRFIVRMFVHMLIIL